MCYSSKVSQNIKDLARQFSATMDYSEVERLLMERLGGRPIRLARGFEWNFSNPQTPQERRIADLDAEYRAKKVAELEQDIFKQKKRLADAQRKLKVKETKSALNEQRIATSKIDASLERIALLTGTQPHEDDHRIFPMTYAPIILKRDGRNVITLARYHLRQQGKPAFTDQKFPGLYNARRDNLERFWRSEFGHTHALMVIDSFYENVERDGKNVVLHFTPRPAYQTARRVPVCGLVRSEGRSPAVVRGSHRRTAAGDQGRRTRSVHHQSASRERRSVAHVPKDAAMRSCRRY